VSCYEQFIMYNGSLEVTNDLPEHLRIYPYRIVYLLLR